VWGSHSRAAQGNAAADLLRLTFLAGENRERQPPSAVEIPLVAHDEADWRGGSNTPRYVTDIDMKVSGPTDLPVDLILIRRFNFCGAIGDTLPLLGTLRYNWRAVVFTESGITRRGTVANVEASSC
jgi:hypothetical protein